MQLIKSKLQRALLFSKHKPLPDGEIAGIYYSKNNNKYILKLFAKIFKTRI